jgi:hypothetical protein
MPRRWTHVGRCWTNGEPFLALDTELLPAWRGMSDGAYERLVPSLAYELTSVRVGEGRAGLILTDAEIGDEGWLEVFRADDDAVAVVQAYAEDYPAVLTAALDHPTDDDEPGDSIAVPGGRLAFISAALDGSGPDGAFLLPESPGALPSSCEPDDAAIDASPVLDVGPRTYAMSVRWMTELAEDVVFARWLLVSTSPWTSRSPAADA